MYKPSSSRIFAVAVARPSMGNSLSAGLAFIAAVKDSAGSNMLSLTINIGVENVSPAAFPDDIVMVVMANAE